MKDNERRDRPSPNEDSLIDDMLHPDRADSDELGHRGGSNPSPDASPREQPAVAVDRRGEDADGNAEPEGADDEP